MIRKEKDFTAFQKGLQQLGVSLKEEQLNQFYQYYEMLIEKNKVMNLTAITEYEEVIHKHFLDSISIVLWKGFSQKASFIDIGTGAGFPGIPLKIAFPDLSVVLLDSLRKRVDFLNDVIQKLNLRNITAVHGRAEDFGKMKEYREQFDFCVSRAVANLATLCEYSLPFVKVGGNFIAYKAEKAEEEIYTAQKAITLLGGVLEKTISLSLQDGNIKRELIVIQKKKKCPEKYPRKAGIAKKEPLE